MSFLSVVLITVGFLLDIFSLVLNIRKCIRGKGPSGLPVFPWLMYLAGCLFLGTPWLVRLALVVALTCFHLFGQSIGPSLYSGFLNGRTSLHRAVIFGNVERIRKLIDSGMDVNAKDNIGWTPLHIAACKASEDVIAVLLDAGADPLAASSNGVTPIKLAELKAPHIMNRLRRD